MDHFAFDSLNKLVSTNVINVFKVVATLDHSQVAYGVCNTTKSIKLPYEKMHPKSLSYFCNELLFHPLIRSFLYFVLIWPLLNLKNGQGKKMEKASQTLLRLYTCQNAISTLD